MIRLNICYPHLHQFTNNQEVVEVSGGNVGECLEDLVRQFPGIKSNLYDQGGKLLTYVELYVNGESTYILPEPLATPLKDGDEISLVLVVGGG